MSIKGCAYALMEHYFLAKALALETENPMPDLDLIGFAWGKLGYENETYSKQEKIFRKMAALCGEETDLREILLGLANERKKLKKGRGLAKTFKVTFDRTKKRQMVRAKFDGSPWFNVGDTLKLEMRLLDNEPALVLTKTEKGEDE